MHWIEKFSGITNPKGFCNGVKIVGVTAYRSWPNFMQKRVNFTRKTNF